MCAIHGLVTLDGRPCDDDMLSLMVRAVLRGKDRGRDSWGVATATGEWVGAVGTLSAEQARHIRELTPARWVMANNRAEPTTEFQPVKTRASIQPFNDGRVWVAHNGTIANDKALAVAYKLTPRSTVDSAVVPALVRLHMADGFQLADAVRHALAAIVGSYALAVGELDGPLVLAANYRPLHLLRMGRHIVFSSQLDYVDHGHRPLTHPAYTLPPYSLATFDEYGGVQVESLRHVVPSRKALVVCSGGLDSTVAAAAMRHNGYDVTLLHFTYGCRAEQREVQAVHDVAAKLDADVLVVDVRQLFTQVIGGSPLTNTAESIADGEAGAEFAHEWVPARNLILLSMAVGIAESHGYSTVVLGNNLEEAGAYPDNEQEFIRLLNLVMPYAVRADCEVHIEMPVGTLVKHEIVALGHELDAPIAQSWSCYNGGDVHCGTCGPCYMRRNAHTMRNIPDPTEYAT